MTRNVLLATILLASFTLGGCATSGSPTDDGFVDAESTATSPGSVDLWQSTDAQWRFHVVAGNGRTLLTSEGYTSKASALDGIESVLVNGVDPLRYQLHQTPRGAYNLHLVAGNYETIATTETYASKSNATRAIGACVRAITSYLDMVESTSTDAPQL